MRAMKATQVLLIGIAALTLAGLPALAGGDGAPAGPIGLPQAAAIAEAHAGGEALRAVRSYREGRLVYQVRVKRVGSIVWVVVDSRDGRVVGAGGTPARQG